MGNPTPERFIFHHFPVQEHLAGLRDGYFIGGSTGHKTVEYIMQIMH